MDTCRPSETLERYMIPPERLYVGREKRVYEEARRLAGCISGSSLGRDSAPRMGTYLGGTGVTLG